MKNKEVELALELFIESIKCEVEDKKEKGKKND